MEGSVSQKYICVVLKVKLPRGWMDSLNFLPFYLFLWHYIVQHLFTLEMEEKA